MRRSVGKPSRHKRKSCMFYPEDNFKSNWDLAISIILIFTCLVFPVRIAFVEEDDSLWKAINLTIDTLFFMDIIATFNNAYYDEDYQIVTNRKLIASKYLRSWFVIDLFAVVPFDMLSTRSNNLNDMARFTRLSRMYKLMKLARLLRILKILKQKSQLFK